jgi:hypothetical protein
MLGGPHLSLRTAFTCQSLTAVREDFLKTSLSVGYADGIDRMG